MGQLDKLLINEDFALDTCCLFDHNYNSIDVKSSFKTIGSYVVQGNPKDRPWIACYGGSTTSAIQGSTWTSHLYQLIKEEGGTCCIFNGGCASYNSWNELNKLSRDISTLKPDIVISLGGINDYTVHVHNTNSSVNLRCIEDLAGLDVFKDVLMPPTSLSHAQLFIERSKQMNAICNLHGSRFFRFLQPTLGFGSYLFDLNDPKDRLLNRSQKQ